MDGRYVNGPSLSLPEKHLPLMFYPELPSFSRACHGRGAQWMPAGANHPGIVKWHRGIIMRR